MTQPQIPGAPEPRAGRRAGILVPLFSIPSSRSWGIGEIGDIASVTGWLRGAGQRILQLLPINEMPSWETSPYSALSAMAIDAQFISVNDVEDFAAIGGEPGLEPALRARLDAVRVSATIDYANVRQLKQVALRRSFEHFRGTEWTSGTRRASALRAYIADQAWWLEDYAVFRALHSQHHDRPWTEWPVPVRSREPGALAAARAKLAEEILFLQYVQWIAGDQWGTARDCAGDVALFGDLPFMVSGDSADVWVRQGEFRMDASVGVPPDAFSATGQDWGLPVYRWDVIASGGFEWLRQRARRSADLYDGCRVDHLVGFYRTFARPLDGGEPAFTPPGESDQIALGEHVLGVLREPGAEIIAEDLGIVPDFVRQSLARLSVPGYKVFRWERRWDEEGQPFRDPADYPAVAMATSGTHDTEPLTVWWEAATQEDRQAVLSVPSIAQSLSAEDRATARQVALSHAIHEAVLESLYASGADTVILPVQDVFGWRDRINVPATVSVDNWTWRLPWPSERMSAEPSAMAVANQLRAWAARSGRQPAVRLS